MASTSAASDPGERQEDELKQLRDLDRLLCAPDAVLNEDIFNVATAYLRHKDKRGKIKDVIQKLSDGYVGYPAMASLVCEWLMKLEPAEPSASEPQCASAEPHDEYYFLSDLVHQTFAPEKFSAVFEHGAPPVWAERLILEPRGRQLIYRLSAQHANSLLLGWAIKRILHSGLHDAEIAATGRSMAAYFGVFHRLLGRYLVSVLEGNSVEQWHAVAQDVKECSSLGEHTFLFAQAILTSALEHPNSVLLKHISQETILHVQSAAGPAVHMLLPLFSSVESTKDREAGSLVARIFMCHSWRAVDLSHLQQLVDMYSSEQPPAIAVLQHARLFELLSMAVLELRKIASAEFERCALRLLAMASCLSDEDLANPPPTDASPEKPHQATRGWADMAEARDNLQSAGTFLRSLFRYGFKPPKTFEAIDKAVQSPLVATAVVAAIHVEVVVEDYYTDAICLAALPHLLLLLVRIVKLQAAAHARVLALVAQALPVVGSERPDNAKAFIRLLVELLLHGRVMPVLDVVREWSKDADPALVRFFAQLVLAYCEPPYSRQFAHGMIVLMSMCGLARKREGGRQAELRTRLTRTFVLDVKKMKLEGLTTEQQMYVNELSTELNF